MDGTYNTVASGGPWSYNVPKAADEKNQASEGIKADKLRQDFQDACESRASALRESVTMGSSYPLAPGSIKGAYQESVYTTAELRQASATAELRSALEKQVGGARRVETSSDLDILRRIAERGLRLALSEGPKFVDVFQHMLDEIERCKQN